MQEASCWLGRGASNVELYSVSKTVMIISDCTLSTQNAPGAVSTRRKTATIFKGLSGSFPGPSALIRPSYLPLLLISFDLSHSLSRYRESTGRACTLPSLTASTVVLVTVLSSSSRASHWAHPMGHPLNCQCDHHPTGPFLPNAVNSKGGGGGYLSAIFVFPATVFFIF